ncbi:hypothetical protein [Escherichia coli]|uniref:hypothetical protein n=1 Tax=Escherichia coli TaxID=562 RepID=UPI003CEDC756
MDEETPVPQKFGSLEALLMELNRAAILMIRYSFIVMTLASRKHFRLRTQD